MIDVRDALRDLAKTQDISSLGLREIARQLGVKNPQTIKYHLQKLADEDAVKQRLSVRVEKNKLGVSDLVRIPIKGRVSAGPATQLASDEISGYLRVSSNLLRTRNFKDLYALTVSGTSMNRAKVDGELINDGDFAIVDSSKRSPRDGEYVIAIVDNLANIKKLRFDKENEQIVLLSESSDHYDPIFVHPEDSNEHLISGTVVQMIKRPTFS